jgi:hypothetical protein
VITKMIARYLTINQNMLKIVTTWKTDQTQWPPISEKTMLWYVTDGHNMEEISNTVPSNIRKNNAVIRYRWWSQHGRQIKHSDLQYQKKTMLWYVTDGHNMEERSNTVTTNIRKKQCCDTLQMVTTWKRDQTQYPPISEKNNAVIRYRWSQHGRQIKHSTLQYQKNNAVIRYRWWSQPQRNNREDKLKDVLFSQGKLK